MNISRITLALVVLLSLARHAAAQTGPAEDEDPLPRAAFELSPERIDPFYGSFGTRVPIIVPKFHELEPELALAYDTSGGPSQAGLGWSLSGFSMIERLSKGKGTPAFDRYGTEPEATGPDAYYLDGKELVPCAAVSGPSPSCAYGGTHASKVETYVRIELDASGWTITRTDGTRMIYTPILYQGDDPFRWGLAIVVDRHNNIVNYVWGSTDGYDNYPAGVLYNGNAIQMYWEPRPDPIRSAAGSGLVTSNHRLRTIDVKVGDERARAYAITYETSEATGRSLVSSIRQYGSDAVLDDELSFTGGRVLAGTALPPIPLEVSAENSASNHHFDEAEAWGDSEPFAAWSAHWTGDFNGDGATDLMYVPGSFGTGGGYTVRLAKKDGCVDPLAAGCFEPPATWAEYAAVPDWRSIWVRDFNGDGRDDLLYVAGGFGVPGGYFMRLSNGAGFDAPVFWSDEHAVFDRSAVWVADYDGDGLPDVMFARNFDAASDQFWVMKNLGTGFGAPEPWGTYGATQTNGCMPSFLSGFETEPNFRGTTGTDTGLGHIGRVTMSGNFDEEHLSDWEGGDVDLYGFYVPEFMDVRVSARTYAAAGDHQSCNGDMLLQISDASYTTILHYDDNGGFGGCSAIEDVYLPPGAYYVAVTRVPGTSPAYFDYLVDIQITGTCGVSGWKSVMPTDLNGDGKQDLLYVPAHQLHWVAMISSGDGFRQPENFGPYESVPHRSAIRTGDFNGDGKADVLYLSAAFDAYRVMLSAGSTLNPPEVWAPYETVDHLTYQIWIADLNADGKSDLVYARNGSYYARLSDGTQFGPAIAWAPYETLPHLGVVTFQDFTGDGMADLMYQGGPANAFTVAENRGLATADLYTEVGNGLGGSTQLEYAPSSRFESDNAMPLFHAVSSMSIDDGNGTVGRTTFEYSGGRFDYVERRFLGYSDVTRTRPCVGAEVSCPRDRMELHQGLASAGKPRRVERIGSSGRVLSATELEYAVQETVLPYTCLERANEVTELEDSDSPASRTTRTEREYDEFSNATLVIEYGDVAISGDERTTRTTYRPNTADYLVSLPAQVEMFAGAGTSGPLAERSRNHYDGASDWNTPPVLGDLTQELRWHDATDTFVVWDKLYDSAGNEIWKRDPNGVTVSKTYDPVFNIYEVSSTNALGHTTATDWDAICGRRARVVDPNSAATVFSYDRLCRLSRVDEALGGFTRKLYLSLGDAVAQRVRTERAGPRGGPPIWEEVYFDGLGRERRRTESGATAGVSIATDTGYDARGNKISMTAPYQGEAPVPTRFSFDALDRAAGSILPDGATTSEVHRPGSVTSIDELGHVVISERNAHGSVVRERHRHGSTDITTSFRYDVRQHLIGLTDHAGNTWAYGYDSLGRKTFETDPDRGHRTFEHDPGGRLTATVDALGQRVEHTYDALDRRLTRTSLPGTPQESVVTWSYDRPRAGFRNAGRLTGASDAGGTATYDYDAAGRWIARSRTIDGTTYSFERAFDEAGRLLWLRFPDGDSVGSPADSLRYDAAGRLRAIPGILALAEYEPDDQLSRAVMANETETVRTFAPARRWMTSLRTSLGDTVLQDLSYTRDAEGKITAVDSSFAHEAWSYSYDGLHRLTAARSLTTPAETQAYAYDDIGNLIESSAVGCYSYPPAGSPRPHAAIAAGLDTYQYDDNGNMISRAGQPITWDAEERAVTIGSTVNVYDADGERVKQIANGVTTYYLGDGYEVSGGTATKYINSGSAPIAKRVGTATYWLHADHLGSVQVITNAAGHQVQRFEYRPYGEKLAAATAHPEALGYIGEHEDSTGLLYLHARFYDPRLARFIAADPTSPVKQGVGLNRYAYSGNNPITRLDKNGLWWFGDPLPESVFNFSTGLADSLSFGLGPLARAGINKFSSVGISGPDMASGAYLGGSAVGIVGTAFGPGIVNLTRLAFRGTATRGTGSLAEGAATVTAEGWQNIGQGMRLQKAGDVYVKEVNPNANAIAQWWGRGTMDAQVQGLEKLGTMAPKFFYKDGRLIIQDAGAARTSWDGMGHIWLEGSRRLGTVFNDIRAKNVGASGLIFDPAKHWLQRSAEGFVVQTSAGVEGRVLADGQ